VDLAQESALVGDFMDHHEGQGEVGLDIDTQAIRFTLLDLNPVGHTRLLCSTPQHVEHLLLEIHGGHLALIAN
jgi:hypothetical protein